MVVGASIALATKRRPASVSLLARRMPVARPFSDDDLARFGIGDHRAAARFDQPPQRVGEARRPAHRQGELHHVGEDQRKHDARARHALGRDDVHVGGEQGADAVVVEMLAHDAEQVVLGMRQEFLGLCARQAIAQGIERERRIERERGEQRAHRLAVEMMERPKRLGIPLRETAERCAGGFQVLVDDHAGAVAERGRLLHRRLDIGKSEAIELQVAQQRRMAKPHEEIGMQIEAIAGERGLGRRAAAADPGVSLDHRDLEASARQIGRQRQSVVPGPDDDTVVGLHALLPNVFDRRVGYSTSPRSTMAWIPLLPSTSWVTRRSQARLQKT